LAAASKFLKQLSQEIARDS